MKNRNFYTFSLTILSTYTEALSNKHNYIIIQNLPAASVHLKATDQFSFLLSPMNKFTQGESLYLFDVFFVKQLKYDDDCKPKKNQLQD